MRMLIRNFPVFEALHVLYKIWLKARSDLQSVTSCNSYVKARCMTASECKVLRNEKDIHGENVQIKL